MGGAQIFCACSVALFCGRGSHDLRNVSFLEYLAMAYSSYSQLFILVSLLVALFPSCLRSEPTGVLHISTLTENSVEGEYRESATSERGIRFVSSPDTLAITTLDGAPLLIADEPRAEGSLRVVSIAGQTFVQHKKEEKSPVGYSVPTSMEDTIKSVRSKPRVYARSLEGLDPETHSTFAESSIQNLLIQPEVDLIKPAAFALGAQGINGKEYPAILPFYLAALQLEKISANKNSEADSFSVPSSWYNRRRFQRQTCLRSCPPCPNDDCLGMCGLGCTCWSFLCGDCCYHLGCFGHDQCCRQQFFQVVCLFPVGFSCDTPYRC